MAHIEGLRGRTSSPRHAGPTKHPEGWPWGAGHRRGEGGAGADRRIWVGEQVGIPEKVASGADGGLADEGVGIGQVGSHRRVVAGRAEPDVRGFGDQQVLSEVLVVRGAHRQPLGSSAISKAHEYTCSCCQGRHRGCWADVQSATHPGRGTRHARRTTRSAWPAPDAARSMADASGANPPARIVHRGEQPSNRENRETNVRRKSRGKTRSTPQAASSRTRKRPPTCDNGINPCRDDRI